MENNLHQLPTVALPTYSTQNTAPTHIWALAITILTFDGVSHRSRTRIPLSAFPYPRSGEMHGDGFTTIAGLI
jgi:hypothetical protein